MDELFRELENFNLIKYTGHYVFTIDNGMGKPIIFQGEELLDVIREVKHYLQRTRKYRL